MRMAEIVMGIVMGVFSLYLMWKSAERPNGWTEGRAGDRSGTPCRSIDAPIADHGARLIRDLFYAPDLGHNHGGGARATLPPYGQI